MPKVDISVRELVDKVRHGDLLLPEMQRRYVWPATRVRDLLDSLYRGYPSGTILVWETDDNIETRGLAIEATNAPIMTRKLLLLDGQQRITSLASIISGEPVKVRNRRRPIDILFNLEHPDGAPVDVIEVEEDYTAKIEDIEEDEDIERDVQEELKKRAFVVSSKSLLNDPIWISVSDIFKKIDSDLLRPLNINSDDPRWDKYSQRLKKIRDIANYMYVMQVLEKDKNYEEVTEIFVRVNSLGIKLRGSDLAMAQITSKWKGFMSIMEEFAEKFNDDADYILETGLPVRALTVFTTKQSRFKTIGRFSKNRLEESWVLAKEGLEWAYNFLNSNANIDSLGYLSSPFLLIPLATYYILKGKTITNEEEKKLLKWFYYAHMRGHYSMGSSESILDADLAILYKTQSINELINQLHLHVKKFELDNSDIVGKSIRSPFFSMLYFVLRETGAKDWITGLMLSEQHLGKAHEIQYHHIFPKSLLKDADFDKKEINEMANMAFIGGRTNRQILNKEPSMYLEKEVIAKGRELELESQLIPMDKNLWEINKYKEFLDWRRKKIAEEINKFMKKFE